MGLARYHLSLRACEFCFCNLDMHIPAVDSVRVDRSDRWNDTTLSITGLATHGQLCEHCVHFMHSSYVTVELTTCYNSNFPCGS